MKGLAPSLLEPDLPRMLARRPSLFGGEFSAPVMTLKRSALEHNIATMARFCRDRGVDLAPHGKTTMAPKIWRRQLAAGAWAITVATPEQIVVCRRAGVSRIFLANELVDAATITWLRAELDADPSFQFLCYVDSAAGAERLASVFGTPSKRPLDVVVEVGFSDGRTGCRTLEQVVEVAQAVAASPALRLVGVAGFEGGIGVDLTPAVFVAVDDFLGRIHAAATELLARELVTDPGEGIVLSAGGSVFFDRAGEILTKPLPGGRRPHCVIRSGCYVTHDSGFYARMSPFSRPGADPTYSLVPALEVWGEVLSNPEPGLALVGIGRRDVPFDLGLPVPRLLRPAPDATDDGAELRDISDSTVRALNDQHAYVMLGAGTSVQPGDWMSFGISHPCTAFDKWRVLLETDDQHRVVDVVETEF